MAQYDTLLSVIRESKATNAPATNAVDALAPLSRAAQAQAGQLAQNAPPSALTAQGNLSWFERNRRRSESGAFIPLDTESGINLGEFSRMVWQRRPEERLAVLRKMFPNQVVRLADTGEPIVEVMGPAGQRQDVLVNPPGLNAEDLIEVFQQGGAPTAGGAVGLVAGQALGSRFGPAGSAVGKVIGAAVGSGVGGAIEDLTARKAESLPLNASEIAKTQAEQAALNALFDFGLWAPAKAMRIVSPFATTRGPAQFDLAAAKNYFRDVKGVNFVTTAAEESGSEALARLERTESQLPGASAVLRKIYKRTQEDLSGIYKAALGARVPDEALGRELIGVAQRELVAPAEKAVQSARGALVRQGESDLANTIDTIAPTAASRKEAGEAIRTEFEAARNTAKGKVDAAYAAVRSIPGGEGKLLPGNPVASAAVEIEKELPKVLNVESTKAFDAYGNPIEKKVVRPKVLTSARPEGLQTFLSDMKAQQGQLMSLDELTRLKNAAHDEIAKTEAVKDVKDRWFGLVQNAYDKAIDAGVAGASDPALKNALENARTVYKRDYLPFAQEGVHDILRTPYESGFQSPEQLVSRLFSGGRAEHNYRALQQTLGASSPAFASIRRSVLDGWVEQAKDKLTGRINPAVFEASLDALKGAHPEIYKDVLKGREQQFAQALGVLRASGKELRDVDADELSALFKSGPVTASGLQRLQLAQKERDELLANTYLRNLSSDKPNKVSPTEFVRALFNSDIDTGHLTQVLSKLSPAEMERLQAAALYRVSTKAAESNVDMSKFLRNEPSPVQGFALAKALGPVGSAERARNELLLGPDHEQLVKQTIALMTPREMKTGLFGAAGSMAATGMLEKLLSMPLQYAQSFAKKAAMALGYTSEPIKKALINQVEGPMETAAFANMLIASEPFMRELVDTYGKDAAFSITRDLKRSIDRFVAQDTQPSEAQSQQGELLRFIQGERAARVKTNTIP